MQGFLSSSLPSPWPQEQHLCSTPAGKLPSSTTSSTAARLAAYQSRLPERAVRRGLASMGDPARMRRVVDKLLAGGRCLIMAGRARSLRWGVQHRPQPVWPRAQCAACLR